MIIGDIERFAIEYLPWEGYSLVGNTRIWINGYWLGEISVMSDVAIMASDL